MSHKSPFGHPLASPHAMVENPAPKPVGLPGEARPRCFLSDAPDSLGPLETLERLTLRALHEQEREQRAWYGPMRTERPLQQVFDHLLRIHCSLRLRESAFFLAAGMLHRYFRSAAQDFDLNQAVVAALFIAHKFEVTEGLCYRASTLAEKFLLPPDEDAGERERRREHAIELVLSEEARILAALDFRAAAVCAYDLLHHYCRVAELSEEGRSLALFLVSAACFYPEHLDFLPSVLAAAAVSLALQHSQARAWTEELGYWSGLLPADFALCRGFLLGRWRELRALGQGDRKPFLLTKFGSRQKQFVSEIEPPKF